MFAFLSNQTVTSANKQRFMKGALALVGALFLLWLIVWLLPTSSPPPVTSDAAGTVAAQPSTNSPSLLTPGRITVILLLGGGIGFALYLRSRSSSTPASPSPVHILGQVAINQDQQLTLVRCQDDVLLLGVSPNEITLLRTYADASFAEEAFPVAGPSAAGPSAADAPPVAPDPSLSGFANVLRQYTNPGRHA
jgi:flagellar biogenesis protein FliO